MDIDNGLVKAWVGSGVQGEDQWGEKGVTSVILSILNNEDKFKKELEGTFEISSYHILF